MKILYRFVFPVLFCFFLKIVAQTGIGTTSPHTSTALDIVSSNKGFLGPRIALSSRSDNTTINNPADGLLVYNTTTLSGNEDTQLKPGYYYWYNGSWRASKEGQILYITTDGTLKSYLGYDPTGTHNSNNFTLGGITYTGIGCKQWTGAGANGHWYCAYTVSKTTPEWQEVFNAAKSRGGYLATFTSLDEWNWFKTNIINQTTGYNITSSVWIGYNKVNFSGNPTEFNWITGETSKILWNNNSSTEDAFRSDEPNNSGGNEGCVHIVAKSQDVNSGWNDINCKSPGWAGPYNSLVIEFEQ